MPQRNRNRASRQRQRQTRKQRQSRRRVTRRLRGGVAPADAPYTILRSPQEIAAAHVYNQPHYGPGPAGYGNGNDMLLDNARQYNLAGLEEYKFPNNDPAITQPASPLLGGRRSRRSCRSGLATRRRTTGGRRSGPASRGRRRSVRRPARGRKQHGGVAPYDSPDQLLSADMYKCSGVNPLSLGQANTSATMTAGRRRPRRFAAGGAGHDWVERPAPISAPGMLLTHDGYVAAGLDPARAQYLAPFGPPAIANPVPSSCGL